MAFKESENFSDHRPGIFYGYIVVMAASLIMVVVYGVHYSFGVFFKPVLTEFGWTRAMTSGAFSLAWLVHGWLGVVMGGMNDRFGPRVVLTICGLLFGLGYLLMSQVGTIWQLYLFYGVIVGSGLGGVYVPLTSTVARWFITRRGVMTGIVAAGIGIGTLVAPPVANWLITSFDWRLSYIILGLVVLVVVVLGAQFLKRDPTLVGQIPYGEHSGAGPGAVREDTGLSLKEAVQTGQFWLISFIFFCFGFGMYSIILHIAPHATDMGVSAAGAAGILAGIGGASIVGKVIFGYVADRIGNRAVYVIGFVLLSACLLWLIPAHEMWMLYIFVTVFGLAYGCLATAQPPLVAWLFGIRSHGLIYGVCTNGFTIGGTIGPIISGYIFDVSGSYKLAFLLLAVMGIIGLVLTLILRPVGSKLNKISILST